VEAERNALYNWVLENQRLECACKQCWYSELMTIFDDDFYEKATAEITTNIVAPLHLTSLL
jgi:uncharacterized oxidoreductase